MFLGILKPNPKIFCPVNKNYVLLLNLAKSGKRYIQNKFYFCKHVSDRTNDPSISIFFRMQDFVSINQREVEVGATICTIATIRY